MLAPGCTSGETPEPMPRPAPSFTTDADPSITPEPTPSGPSELLFLRGRELVAYDLATGTETAITELPSPDVAVSPDGKLLVATVEGHPQGPGPEGYREPLLVVASTSGPETPSELGPGRAPVWAPNSAAVAAIAPTDAGESIVVYNLPGTPNSTPAPDDESWSIVGWHGTDVVAIGSRSGVVAVPSAGGDIRPLRVAPSNLWGVSPTGEEYLAIEGGEVRIAGTGGQPLEAIDGTLGDGTWSGDGGHVAVSILQGNRSSLAVIDVARARVTSIEEGRGAQGNVVWAAGSERFAFVRVDPANRGRLQAVTCTPEGSCEELFSWVRDVRLLAFR